MKKKILIACCALCAPLLSGCEIAGHFVAQLSEIFAEPKMSTAKLVVEISDCYNANSRLDSRYLLEAKSKVDYVLPGSKFLACEKINIISSLATFDVPLQIGGIRETCNPDALCVYHAKSNLWVNLKLGDRARSRLLDVESEASSTERINLQIGIDLYNDMGKNREVYIPCGYIYGEPRSNAGYNLKKGSMIRIILSDVQVAQLKAGQYVNVMMSPIPDQMK